MKKLNEVKSKETNKIPLEHTRRVKNVTKFLLQGSGARFDIMLELVGRGKASFKELQEETGLKSASLNHHLKVLLKEGYIEKRRLNTNSRSDNRVEYYPTERGIEMLSYIVDVDSWKASYNLTEEELEIMEKLKEIREMEHRGVSREEIEKKFNQLIEKYGHKLHSRTEI